MKLLFALMVVIVLITYSTLVSAQDAPLEKSKDGHNSLLEETKRQTEMDQYPKEEEKPEGFNIEDFWKELSTEVMLYLQEISHEGH